MPTELRVRVPQLQPVVDDLRDRLTATETIANAALTQLSDDTTPALGGNLDVGTFSLVDANGNELLKFSAQASAVNEVTVRNGATGSSPRISATGGDTNINLNLQAKGNGALRLESPMMMNNQSIVDTSKNEFLKFTSVASAVNELTIHNAASGNDPSIAPSGGGTNLGVRIRRKGTGRTRIDDAWQVVTSSTRPTHVAGMWIYETDTGKTRQSNGTEWLEWADTGAWDTWTPSTTALTVGNGTLTGRYRLEGYTMHWYIALIWGSTTSITGNPKFHVPSGMRIFDSTQLTSPGTLWMFDNSTSTHYTGGVYAGDSGANILTTRLIYGNQTVTSSVPFTWAVNDQMAMSGTIEMDDVNAPTS